MNDDEERRGQGMKCKQIIDVDKKNTLPPLLFFLN